MAKNYSGRDYLVYLSASAPATADISTSYTLVGLSRDLSIDESRNAIDKSTKDDGDDSTFVAGRRNVTISGTAVWDHTGDTGQAIIGTQIRAAAGTIWFLITTGTVGDEEFYGSAIVTNRNLSFPDEDVSMLSYNLQATGAVSQATGDSTT